VRNIEKQKIKRIEVYYSELNRKWRIEIFHIFWESDFVENDK